MLLRPRCVGFFVVADISAYRLPYLTVEVKLSVTSHIGFVHVFFVIMTTIQPCLI